VTGLSGFTVLLLCVVASGQDSDSPALRFEVSAVRPNRNPDAYFRQVTTDGSARYTAVPLGSLIRIAYGVHDYEVKGPGWLSQEKYDIEANLPAGSKKEQIPLFLRTLLAERFGLRFHQESLPLEVYVLQQAPGGLTAPPAQTDSTSLATGRMASPVALDPRRGKLHVNGPVKLENLAESLTMLMGRPVLDRTNALGEFNIQLDASTMMNSTEEEQSKGMVLPGGGTVADHAPSVFAALRRVGLTLERARVPVTCFIIDKVDKVPTDN
jgi:uncharacterized protein (TIGR03435 family)